MTFFNYCNWSGSRWIITSKLGTLQHSSKQGKKFWFLKILRSLENVFPRKKWLLFLKLSHLCIKKKPKKTPKKNRSQYPRHLTKIICPLGSFIQLLSWLTNDYLPVWLKPLQTTLESHKIWCHGLFYALSTPNVST